MPIQAVMGTIKGGMSVRNSTLGGYRMSRHISMLHDGSDYTSAVKISLISYNGGKCIRRRKSGVLKISGNEIVIVNTIPRNIYIKGAEE